MERHIPNPHTSVCTRSGEFTTLSTVQPLNSVDTARARLFDWDVFHDLLRIPDVHIRVERAGCEVDGVVSPGEGVHAGGVRSPAPSNNLDEATLYQTLKDEWKDFIPLSLTRCIRQSSPLSVIDRISEPDQNHGWQSKMAHTSPAATCTPSGEKAMTEMGAVFLSNVPTSVSSFPFHAYMCVLLS